MNKFLITILLVIAGPCVFAQQILQGSVSDLQTNQPLSGATIRNASHAVIAAADGAFSIPFINGDSLTISHIGYETKKLQITNPGKFLKVTLIPSSLFLNEVIVAGYESNRKLLQTAAGIGVITKNELNRNSNVSLQPALNAIPGVHMDQSHPEDARISIRGVGIQSNFGIRNLKVYLNDIPLTEANGFTRIEGLDISTLGRVEVIKGPASSIYGAALGGVLLFRTEKAPYNETSIEQSVMAGTYGLFRTSTTFRSATDHANLVATYGYQKLSGYRQWSDDNRNFISATGQFYPNQKQTVFFFINHSSQNAHIPGAIDSIQFAQHPRLADSTTFSKKAGRYQTWTRAGLAHSYKFSDHFTNVTSVNLGFFALDHPLAFAYIHGTYQSFGGRTRFSYSTKEGKIKTRITVGAEYLNGIYLNKYYENNEGTEGPLTQDQQTTAVQYALFGQAELEFPGNTLLTLGASNSGQSYHLKDFLKKDGTDFTGEKIFHPRISPRIALLKTFQEQLSVYATVSSAFMPPVDYEISLPDGGISKDVRAVTGVNYEIGSRGWLFSKNLAYDLSVYKLRLSNELIPQTVAPYQVVYVNTGKTDHNGVELSLSWTAIHSQEKSISLLKPYLAYSHNHFIFKSYSLDGNRYDGNKLTGISPNMLTLGLDGSTRPGFYLHTSVYYQDAFPMTDDNTKFNNAYAVWNSKIGFKKMIGHFDVDMYGGLDNIPDAVYASYIELNASPASPGAPPKFYNPSPRRNFYAGVSIKYIL